MAGLDTLLSTLHPPSRESRRMTRSRTGSLFLRSCRTFIRYSHPAFTGAFPGPDIGLEFSWRFYDAWLLETFPKFLWVEIQITKDKAKFATRSISATTKPRTWGFVGKDGFDYSTVFA
jgi:hypothetical protein